ncbi:MAG: multidrug effflux MFS transporter [Devosia sp.]|jgi:DHA1 family bicyclomycin/chloramphenicol resistance-like MFS transporter|uniref:multidrug effflux MFS transporter n=1 Tax=unclassified Devosia TaxID=196773 RepID=UPI0019FDF1D6|nr:MULTISPECIES: multidrug effflux MFS transporter [unclassified Devosia]MBF0680258.1 multidrug effflux MFS transporter [Devosia sp.]WEJ34870.1 multidrug effflux MFS transporter [Devosia sp. SD17-2]
MSDHFTRVLSRPHFIALIAAIMTMNAIAVDVMLPALPYMGDAYGITTENERQFVITFYSLGMGIAVLAFGPLSDRFGRRAPLFAGLALYVVAAIAAVFAPDFTTLLALRFIQGVGAASARVVTTAVVRDKYSGREMAEVMSLTFMVFMAVPIVAPGIGQILLLTGPWQAIFVFMGVLAAAIAFWAFLKLPETLPVEQRRPMSFGGIALGFKLVFTNRTAFFYGLAGMFLFGALMGFITSAQQVYVEAYDVGMWFTPAFAAIGALMAVSSFTNSRVVRRLGMRRLAHSAIIVYTVTGAVMFALALTHLLPFPAFYGLLAIVMFCFGWSTSNMNSLSMEPLGKIAGTAAATFAFIQTVGGTLIGTYIGQHYNGTAANIAGGYLSMGIMALICVLIAEKGKLFGVGEQYNQPAEPAGH